MGLIPLAIRKKTGAFSQESESEEVQMAAANYGRYPRGTQVIRGSVLNRWQRFFFFAGGFDSETLAEEGCRAVRSKYCSMGALILLTALLAASSGGYAIYTTFHDGRIAVVLTLPWALMIFVLDRFLVSSARKRAVLKNFFRDPNPTRPYFSRTPWALLGLRLPIAIVIGLVVSKPIEVRLLEPWIAQYERVRTADELKRVPDDSDFVQRWNEIDDLGKAIADKDGEVAEAVRVFDDELDRRRSLMVSGYGDNAKKKEVTLIRLSQELDNLKKQKEGKQQLLDDDIAKRRSTVGGSARARMEERSVISDLAAIQKLASGETPEARDRSPVVSTVSLFLTLLFVLIECMPVIAKALSPFDPYDAKLQAIEDASILDCLVEARRKYAESGMSDAA
jgi:hypothetical protein